MSSHPVVTLAVLTTLAGCAMESPTPVVSDGVFTEEIPSDEVAADEIWDPPYAGLESELRIELGILDAADPGLGIAVDRLLAQVDGSWRGMAISDEAVDAGFSTSGSWTPIWEGDRLDGDLRAFDVMLAEHAALLTPNGARDVVLAADDRDFVIDAALPAAWPRPIVVTVLLDIEDDGTATHVHPARLLVREVDDEGYAWDLGTLGE